ncbi:MAG: hypothetical protein ACI86H_002142 [bacterium]|jgi:hypothetical protein
MSHILIGDFNLASWLQERSKLESVGHSILEEPHLLSHAYNTALSLDPGLLRTPTTYCSHHYLADDIRSRIESLFVSSVTSARQIIENNGKNVLLAGSIGPVGTDISKLDQDEIDCLLSETAVFLADVGIDVFLMEGFTDVAHFNHAATVIRRVSSIPLGGFFKIQNEKDLEKIPDVFQSALGFEMDLVGLQVDIEMLPMLESKVPSSPLPLGMQVCNSKGIALDYNELSEHAQMMVSLNPTMVLGGDGFSVEDWIVFKDKVLTKLEDQ